MLSMRPNLGRRRARLALTSAAVGAALALAPSGGAVGRYADPTGDNKGAPDVTGVTVTSDAAGNLLFQIGIVDLPSPADVETLLILNTDANVATGAPDTAGADYIFVVDEADNSYGFARWNGADWDWDTPYATVAIQTDRTSVSIAVNRSDLGNTESLNFRVRTIAGEFETGQHDDAPESGSWNYTLAAGGPDITGVIVATKPGFGPRAGKPFTLTPIGLQVAPDDEGVRILPQPESYRCTVRIAGRLVRGTAKGGCTVAIPRKARGKRVAVALTVTYQGAAKSFQFTYRVS